MVGHVLDQKVPMELAIADVQERYRTLQLHDIDGVDPNENSQAEKLLETWQETVDAALTRDVRLVKVKAQFTDVTKADVAKFSESADELRAAYHASGPTSLSVGLTQGLAAMAEFRKRLAEAMKEREALMNAERLFGLPLTRYPQLQEVQDDLDHVAPLYTLYSDLLTFSETNSNMLWADLDINALQKGAEDLAKRLLRLKDLKGTSVFNAVTDEVTNFRESLPLIASLKNPAMKERHWDKISALTGVKIAANNPKAFT
jgi:dynein heavy chain, axonemal